MSKLVVISDGLAGLSHELGRRWVTIGRGDKNAFQIVEKSVSNQHCDVLLRSNELVVRDLCSTNGTFIGGKTISEAVLQPGQILRLGLVELRLEISEPAPAAAPQATVSSPAGACSPAPAQKSESAGSLKTYRVLFVDDSLAFLEMITELFGAQTEKSWEIHTAPSADKALAILQQKLINLVVLDIGMPLLDGVQLLGIIHQQYPNVKKVILTAQSDESRRAACLANGAELFLLKPGDEDGWRLVFNMLSNVLRWSDSNDFISTLSETGLFDVIQLECLGGNSSVFEVRNRQIAGEIYIEGGTIVHASTGKLVGEKAFHQLLSLTDGEFRLIPFRPPPKRTVQRQWESLLAETARVREQENYSADDDETILVTKKMAAKKSTSTPPPSSPPATPPPPNPIPVEAPQPEARRATSGMNFITLEELVEADTNLVSDPDNKGQPSGDPKK
ncbi:MAG: response regulator [Verrucomicrobiota bacterium]|jgi:CheY-like chemotaxis protein